MRNSDSHTRELDDDSREYPAQPSPPTNQTPPTFAAVAILLVMALGAAILGVISTYHPATGATGASTSGTPTVARATSSPTPAVSWIQAPKRGAGLPKGMEVFTFKPTGPDEGWGTGGVITDTNTGFPDRSMVLRYAAGSWTQVGAALPGVYLSGVDMISPSEGWAMGVNDSDKGYLLHISNGGWQQESLPTTDPQGAVAVMAMRTPDEGWMALATPKATQGGASNSLLHYTGGVWSPMPIPIKFITDIAPIADGEAWVIGWNTNSSSSLVHVQGGQVTVELTSPGNTTFNYLRMFAPNDIWIEAAMHSSSNLDVEDVPLNYHYDGVAWSKVNLQAPRGVQHVSIVSGDTAWGFASVQPAPPNESSFGEISSIYAKTDGKWKALSVPYNDLQSIEVVSSSSTDIWAIAIYMVTTPVPGGSSSVSHSVLLRYTDGAWTEYGR